MGIPTDGDILLRAIIANPDDDDPRLQYADWLEENGQAERAEFIRVQIEKARTPICKHEKDMGIAPAKCRRCQLRGREAFLMIHDLPNEWHGLPPHYFACANKASHNWKPKEKHKAWAWFDRGFVERLYCTLADSLEYGSVLVASNPVSMILAVDMIPIVFPAIDKCGWRRYANNWVPENYDLPEAVFDRLREKNYGAIWQYYDSFLEAEKDLSASILQIAHEEAEQERQFAESYD